MMDGWVDIRKDGRHVAREREKARILRKSEWWRAQLRKGVCHYCGRKVGAGALTMDHVIPVARGGRSVRGNVVPACLACNRKKKFLTPAEQALDALERQGLLPPPDSTDTTDCQDTTGPGEEGPDAMDDAGPGATDSPDATDSTDAMDSPDATDSPDAGAGATDAGPGPAGAGAPE